MPLSFLTKHGSIVLKWNELIFCYYTRRTLIDRNHLYAIYILPISKFLSASLLYGFLDKTMEKISLGMMVTYCDIHSPRAKVPLIKCCGGLFCMKQNRKFGLVWTKVIIEKSRGGRFFWNRNWDLGWIWAGSATCEAGFFMLSFQKNF